MQSYSEIVEEVAGMDVDEFSGLSEQYGEFLDAAREDYGAFIHGMGPVSGPLEAPEGLYDFDIGMTAGAIRAGMRKSEDGEEFVNYLEEDLMAESEEWEVAARAVVEQVFPEIL